MHPSIVREEVRNGNLDIGRKHYVLSLLLAVEQAQHSGYDKIVAIEFGVGAGHGLLSLVQAAEYCRTTFNINIEVYGFDSFEGLPLLWGYKDHPEIWSAGQFIEPDIDGLIAKLPSWCHLIVGNIEETINNFTENFWQLNAKIGFVSVDVDLYHSTVFALKIFEMLPDLYLPAVPTYFDDVNILITMSKYAGEMLAISEFNKMHVLRKIEERPNFRIDNFFVCHIFDHPMRTGEIKPAIPFEIRA